MPAIVFQDPTQSNPIQLVEVLLRHADGASRGGAAFAWASEAGVKMLIRDRRFEELLKRGTFHLIVGLDTTTDTRAVEALRAAENTFPALKLQMFVTPPEHGIFHPKLAWFSNEKGGAVVVGSGNLTARGLMTSWEAFSDLPLREDERTEVESRWNSWTKQQQEYLFAASSQAVAERAQANINEWSEERVRLRTRGQPRRNSRVLICEIGKGRVSKKGLQVDVGIEAFEQFFRIRSSNDTVLLSLVQDSDKVLSYRTKAVQKSSGNFCFDMNVPSYDSGARPIAIFLELRSGVFLYAIIRHEETDYEGLQAFLQENLPDRAEREMKRWSAEFDKVDHFATFKMLWAAQEHIG